MRSGFFLFRTRPAPVFFLCVLSRQHLLKSSANNCGTGDAVLKSDCIKPARESAINVGLELYVSWPFDL